MNDLRFDLSARVECFVTSDDIRQHPSFTSVMAFPNAQDRICGLRQIAVRVAQVRLNAVGKIMSGIEVTADVDLSHIDHDRIDWQELATPQ